MCVKGNQIYIIDQTNSYLQHYDAEQQEFKTAIEASFNTSIRIAAREDDVYTCCFKGIYHTKESGKEFQKVLDAKTYHFFLLHTNSHTNHKENLLSNYHPLDDK